MTLKKAIRFARSLATSNDVQLGECLFAEPLAGMWVFQFGIIDGPADWSWVILATEIKEDAEMLAIRNRPPAGVHPRLRTWATHEWGVIDRKD